MGYQLTGSIRLAILVFVGWPTLASAQSAPTPDADPRIQQLVAAVSQQRLQQLDATLASFGTRHTLSDGISPARGIRAARQWILDELKRSSPRLQVSADVHKLPPQGRILRDVELWNIVAVLPGNSPRRIYVTGHYDTLNLGPGVAAAGSVRPAGGPPTPDPQLQSNFDFNADAPGANDNGSGTALAMELARVFADSGIQFDATLVFVCWAGEEQGLFGARVYAAELSAAHTPVDAVFNNDIVGNSRGGNGVVDAESVRLYAVGPEDSSARALARYIERAAAIYVPGHRVRLMAREDRFGRGSDQSAFTASGYAAVVFREANEDLSRQHSAADTVDGVDFAYLTRNARVNAAAAASLALAPPAPKVTGDRGQNLLSRDPSGYDASLRWNASPGAIAYRIYWRDTWSNDWQRQQTVGNVTAFVLPNVSIDDFVFGVAAIAPDGHESLISAYVSPMRRDPEIKLAP